nr:unnamed protein product [Spirometra erinaceieuropaei]
MIAGTKVVSLRYRPLREQDEFFPNGRPAIDPVTCEAILRRPFDIVLILLSLLGMSLCILHFIATISNLPPLPTPSENASLPCGLYRGKWTGPYKVLRFYGVPYAIPPLAMPDLTTEELLDEVLAKSARNHRHLRWLSPQPAEGVEGCIISHHDKCTFQKKSSGGIRLVMTATSNELEGWPYTGEEWTKEDSIEQSKRIVGLMQRLQWTQTGSTDIQKSIDVLLGQVWAQELTRVAKGGANVWPPLRLRQEMHLQFLSFLRFACPQAWFLGTVGATRGEFYQIIHDEAPDAPFPHAPGPWPPAGGIAMPRRFAFHGIDMLILTGREMDSNEGRSARQKRFRAYSAKLRAAFKKFVHGDVLDSKCRTGRGGWSGVLPPFSVEYY